MRLWSYVLIVAAPLSAAARAAPPLVPDASQTMTAVNGATATCMARTTTKKDGQDWEFVVPVPAASQADFTAKGFQPTACRKLVVQLAQHKKFVCEIAQGNDAVQQQTDAQLGIDARKLCAAAKVLVPDVTTAANSP